MESVIGIIGPTDRNHLTGHVGASLVDRVGGYLLDAGNLKAAMAMPGRGRTCSRIQIHWARRFSTRGPVVAVHAVSQFWASFLDLAWAMCISRCVTPDRVVGGLGARNGTEIGFESSSRYQ